MFCFNVFFFFKLNKLLSMKTRLFTGIVMYCDCIAKGFNCMINFPG